MPRRSGRHWRPCRSNNRSGPAPALACRTVSGRWAGRGCPSRNTERWEAVATAPPGAGSARAHGRSALRPPAAAATERGHELARCLEYGHRPTPVWPRWPTSSRLAPNCEAPRDPRATGCPVVARPPARHARRRGGSTSSRVRYGPGRPNPAGTSGRSGPAPWRGCCGPRIESTECPQECWRARGSHRPVCAATTAIASRITAMISTISRCRACSFIGHLVATTAAGAQRS